jgi:hypothetical protein
MPATVEVKIENLDELRRAIRDYPKIANPILADTINASLAIVHQITGNDAIFQFKLPRAKRTGFLQLSFAQGIRLASPKSLWGSIRPTVHYAPYVYFGTSRGIAPNPYIDRIAKAAEPRIQKFFKQAADRIVSTIAKKSRAY